MVDPDIIVQVLKPPLHSNWPIRVFFVIVYDRRGEGRSTDSKATYTFQESFDDIHALYQTHGIRQACLIGHSFGGILATLFAEAYSEKVQAIILVGAPVSLQSSFKNILTKSRMIYEAKKDSVNLKFLGMLEKMDTSSIMYSTYCFGHAMQNGFYNPKNPSPEAKSIYARFRTDSVLVKHASKMTIEGPQGFWKKRALYHPGFEPYIEQACKTKNENFWTLWTRGWTLFSRTNGGLTKNHWRKSVEVFGKLLA
jgi:pimeloyl-ACP methyl ester carboxylesterase